MTICPHSKAACTCQPQEGTLCPHGEQPPYRDGPESLPAPRISLQLGPGEMVPLYDLAQVHALWAQAFEAGRNHEADQPDSCY